MPINLVYMLQISFIHIDLFVHKVLYFLCCDHYGEGHFN